MNGNNELGKGTELYRGIAAPARSWELSTWGKGAELGDAEAPTRLKLHPHSEHLTRRSSYPLSILFPVRTTFLQDDRACIPRR